MNDAMIINRHNFEKVNDIAKLIQISQLSRFSRETHDFSTGLTTACQSHDLAL